MSLRLFVFGCFLLFTSCEEDPILKPIAEDPADIDLVTGLVLRDVIGAPVPEYGNPNISDSGIVLYPNPADYSVIIQAWTRIRKVWFVKGDVNYTSFVDTDFEDVFSVNPYRQSVVMDSALVQYDVDTTKYIIDVTGFPEGYLRVFYLLDNDSLKWSNLVIKHSGTWQTAVQEIYEEWN